MLLAEASSATCVQRFDDSRNSAIHTTYRISLRSSSLREPRYPLLRVVLVGASWPSQDTAPHRERSIGSRTLSEKGLGCVGGVDIAWPRGTTEGPARGEVGHKEREEGREEGIAPLPPPPSSSPPPPPRTVHPWAPLHPRKGGETPSE